MKTIKELQQKHLNSLKKASLITWKLFKLTHSDKDFDAHYQARMKEFEVRAKRNE